jgi:hypothetical protein
MQTFLWCIVAGILFAMGGALVGLAISALLIELSCLNDPGGAAIVFLLTVALAFVGGFYGIVYARFRCEGRRPGEIRKFRHALALLFMAAGGGCFLLNAIDILVSLNPYGGERPATISSIPKLLAGALFFFGAFYGIVMYDRKTGVDAIDVLKNALFGDWLIPE